MVAVHPTVVTARPTSCRAHLLGLEHVWEDERPEHICHLMGKPPMALLRSNMQTGLVLRAMPQFILHTCNQ